MHRRRFPAAFALLFLIAAFGGCRPSQKNYALRGRVVAKNADQLTVNQEDIPGFMPAMTMPYPVKDTEALEKIQPGDAITANLVVNKDKSYWLDKVVLLGSLGRGSESTAANTTEVEEENSSSIIGASLPEVPLVNQDGKTIHLSNFKGKTVLVTFIYTRCPFPTFCPLLSSEFASIQRELSKSPELYQKTHLLSISLDPANDTPPVMRKYGLSYLHNDSAGFAHWDFVSTKPEDLQTLAAAFGLTYYAKDNLITHSTRTVLVAANGTVANMWDGSEWRQPELIDAIAKLTTPGQHQDDRR
jgi:protein SCO1/2